MENLSHFNIVFIRQATQVVIDHIDEADFSVTELAQKLHFSREQTHRKLKKQTGLSSGKFIRYIRLLFAYSYMKAGSESVQEVGYKLGFNDPGYFNKCFKEEWKITPGESTRENPPLPLANLAILKFYQIPEIQDILHKAGVVIESGSDEGISYTPGGKNKKLIYALLLSVVGLIVALQIKLSQPDSKLNIDNQRMAVVPFINNTGDTSLQAIGDIASSWISSQIADLDKVKTVPFFTVKQYSDYLGILPNDVQKRPTFGEVVDASYILQGQYFLKNGRLFFDTELLDAKTQESIYHLPMVFGSQDSVMELVESLRLKIAGLVTTLEEVQLGKLTPPNYDAYKYYLKGLQELANGFYSFDALGKF
ncbi:MAG: helix-turn-helix transcriptional regulator [Saprospiraceae bacterium]|nr:helix-turn-helix transcriptional regulator [Saprospiraceae bacterium]